MTDVLNEEFMLPPEPDTMRSAEAADYADGDFAATEGSQGDAEATAERITAHTQNRLASYAAFEEARVSATRDLGRISEALGNILASQNLNREFLDDCCADIHRANELELGNAALSSENRRLGERVDKLEKLRARYDQLIDVLKRRESKLLQDAEQMRDEMSALRLELVDVRNHAARSDAAQGELQASLASKTAEAERFMREAEMLREKNVGLTLDLDLAQKRQAEMRRKYEDISAIHATDASRLAELSGKLASEENETDRLQKLTDRLETKLVEAGENAARLSADMAEREKRHQSENQSLKMEVQSLTSRLHAATGEQRGTAAEVNELRSKVSDLESEKLILEKKFAALGNEFENERRLFIAQGGHGEPREAAAPVERPRSPERQARPAEPPATEEASSANRQDESLLAMPIPRPRAATEPSASRPMASSRMASDYARQVARRA